MSYEIKIKLADVIGSSNERLLREIEAAILEHSETIDELQASVEGGQ